jgi:hypothetical protein
MSHKEKAKEKADGHPILPCYTVSDVSAHTILDLATNVGASHLIVGAPRRSMLVKLVRGKLDPPGFQVPIREHSFTGLRVTEQSGASARSGLLVAYYRLYL